MPVVGLVVNLASDSWAADRALRQMSDAACLTLGLPPEPRRVPVVLETETDADSRHQLRWLNNLPGVIDVQVVTADFSDLTPPPTEPASPKPAPPEPAPPDPPPPNPPKAAIDAPLEANPFNQEHPDHVLR